MKLLLNMIIITSICSMRSALAHNPNEVNYNIVVNDAKQELVVHFTPMTAIQLVKTIQPELKDVKLIKLENYLGKFEDYFNNTITLSIDGIDQRFALVANNLNTHDATLTFALAIDTEKAESFEITVTSFTEIYRRIENVVSTELYGNTSICVLNTSETYCKSDHLVIAKSGISVNYFYIPLLVLGLGIIGFGYLKKKQV